jgi:hypothetical protein
VLYQQLECFSSMNSRMGFNGKGQVYRYSIVVIPCLWLRAAYHSGSMNMIFLFTFQPQYGVMLPSLPPPFAHDTTLL